MNRTRSVHRLARSIGVALAVTLVSGRGVAFAVAGATGNASINLSKTVGTSKVSPALSVSLGVDRSSAIPGDVITYTATVTNTGAVLAVPGTFKAQNNGDVTATVAAYWDDVEYYSSSKAKWIPLVGFAGQQPGYAFAVPPPITTGMTLNPTPVSSTGVTYPGAGDRILGTSILKGATASWTYFVSASLTAVQVASLKSTSKTGIRNVIHFEATPRAISVGQPFTYQAQFTNPFPTTSAAATNVAVTITLPSGSAVKITSAQVPGLASVAPGASVTAKTTYAIPVIAPKGSAETDSAYVSRLTSAEGSQLKATASATGTGASGPISSPTSSPVSATEHDPVGGISKTGPASAQAGTSATYQLALVNSGGAAAGPLNLSDSLPDGTTGTITGVPSTLAPGASATAQSSIVISAAQTPGPLADTATFSWKDANGNAYGPIFSQFTSQISSTFAGWLLLLSPQISGPDVTGTSQTITAQLTDSQRNPVAGRQVAFTVNGPNATNGSATTGQDGNATFTYTGNHDGTDVVQGTVAQDSNIVPSTTARVSWSTPAQPLSTTPVHGNFFAEGDAQTTFEAAPGDKPAFGQTFPTLDFNPPAGVIGKDASGVTPSTRPFTDVTTDPSGNYTGTIVAQGNGLKAGADTLDSFDAEFTATLVVAKAGDVDFRVIADDGFLLGVGGGAARVSGTYENAPASGLSPFKAYPLVGAFNEEGGAAPGTYTETVHFPAPGSYPYELDYFECCGQDLSLLLTLKEDGTISSTGAGTLYVTEVANRAVAKVTVGANGVVTVDPNWVTGLPYDPSDAFSGPDSIIFDPDGNLITSNYSDGTLSLIDSGTGAILKTKVTQTLIPHSADIALDPTTDNIYVIGVLGPYLDRVSLVDGTTTNIYQSGPGFPMGIAMTADGKRLFIDTGTDSIAEVDPETGQYLRAIFLQDHQDWPFTPTPDGLTIDPTTNTLYVSGCGGLCALSIGTEANPELTPGPQYPLPGGRGDGIAADGQGHVFIAGGAGSHTLLRFDIASGTSSLVADNIPSADDVAPVVGPGVASISAPLPPAVGLTLSPAGVSGNIVGQTQRFTLTATDNAGQPVAGVGVNTVILGPNAQSISATTGSDGRASITYTADHAGTDTATASAFIDGVGAVSNQVAVAWASPPPPTSSGGSPPTISDLRPDNGAVIAAPVDVSATITAAPGDSIASYSVTLEPVAGGSIQTIASGTGAPPTTLGMLDTTSLDAGTYALTVSVNGSDGGSAELTNYLNLTPVPPPAPPTSSGGQPPTISDIVPDNGAVIAVPVPVTATIAPAAGDGIASYDVTLQPTDGGSIDTIASQDGAPLATLGILDPAQLEAGTYALTVNASATSGGSASVTIYVSVVTSAEPVAFSAPSITATPSATTYNLGEAISLRVLVKNNESVACRLSTSPFALQMTDVTVNGQPQTPTPGAVESEDGIPTDDTSFVLASPGDVASVVLVGVQDPDQPETTVLETTDLMESTAFTWPTSQPGEYSVSLRYSAAALAVTGTDLCMGASPTTSVNFTVSGLLTHSRTANGAPRGASIAQANPDRRSSSHHRLNGELYPVPAIPDYIHLADPAVTDPFNYCWQTYNSLFFPDPAGVLGDLNNLISPTGRFPDFTIGVIARGNPRLDTWAGTYRSHTITRRFFSRIYWDENAWYDPSHVYFVGDVPANICASLYHELAHVRDNLSYAAAHSVDPYVAAISVEKLPGAACTFGGDDTFDDYRGIPVAEAHATTDENTYRAWNLLPLRDTWGGYLIPPPEAKCDDVAPQPVPPPPPLPPFN